MLKIQKKIIISDLLKDLLEGGKTRTTLKRGRVFAETDVELAIDFAVEERIFKSLPQGYIEIIDQSYAVLEDDYYQCVEKLLKEHYNNRLGDGGRFLVSKTARRNTKIEGRWTRPDFTVVANRKFPYIKESEFDIITFEVKRPKDCGVLAVFEALAHNTAATRSYVFFPISEREFDKTPQAERIREECIRHGVGLFLVNDDYKLSEACLEIESRKKQLNPEKCSQFLQSVLDPTSLSKITTWP